jgi:hypothetical protein
MKAQTIQLRDRTVYPPSLVGVDGDRRPWAGGHRIEIELYCAIWFLNTVVSQVLAVASRACWAVMSPMMKLW